MAIYDINYNDERFQQVKNEESAELKKTNSTYNEMLSSSDSYYQQMIDETKNYADKQQQLQQDKTDLTIEKIEQQKGQAEQDYKKEQKAAYTDYKKASGQYGANAEALASQGMSNTGYSESSQVSMYNQYQNRYMTAREGYNRAVLNYENSIKEAQLANNSALAEIAYQALQKQLELSLQGFQYKNTLLLQQLEAQREIDNTYYQRWQNVLSQINTENALKEQVRQYNESLAFQKAEAEREQTNWEKEYELSKAPKVSSSIIKNNAGVNNSVSNSKKGINDIEGLGSSYDSVYKQAVNLYNSAGTNKVSAVEALLASCLSSGQVTEAGVAVILTKLGLN